MTEINQKAPVKAVELIRRGFLLANKNPALWLFGIFVMFPPIGPTIGLGGWDLSSGRGPLVGLIGFVLFLCVAAMRLIGSAGLVHGVVAVGRDEKLTAKQIFAQGKAPFWKLLGLHLLWLGSAIVLSVVFAIIVAMLRGILSAAGDTLAVLAAVLLAGIVTVAMAGLAITFVYAVRFVVLREMPAFKAATAGAALLWNNKGVNVRLVLLQGAVWLLGTLVVTVAGAVLTKIPLVGAVALFFLSLAANGFVGAAFHAMYTEAFGKLTGDGSAEPEVVSEPEPVEVESDSENEEAKPE
jgi:hypothetical protein